MDPARPIVAEDVGDSSAACRIRGTVLVDFACADDDPLVVDGRVDPEALAFEEIGRDQRLFGQPAGSGSVQSVDPRGPGGVEIQGNVVEDRADDGGVAADVDVQPELGVGIESGRAQRVGGGELAGGRVDVDVEIAGSRFPVPCWPVAPPSRTV